MVAAAIKGNPRYDYRIISLDNSGCELLFSEDGKELGKSSFTEADAKAAGLHGKENWKKWPRNMYFARALSNGMRWYCPDVFNGNTVYTPDELGAEINGETGEIITSNYEVIEPPMKPEPKSYDAATVAAVIEAGSTENSHSFAQTIKKADLPADADKDLVVDWFGHYREAREADADSDEAAIQANAWWEGEKPLYEALRYTTDSGKILGELGPDELVEMVDKIGELPDPSLKMLTIKQHCLTLLDYLKSLEVTESE